MKTPTRRQFIGYLTGGFSSAVIGIRGAYGNTTLGEVFKDLPNSNPISPNTYPQLPTIPYGAVYYRKTNPPPEDWKRDYQQAASDGMNAFRHWFMWSAIETAPGAHDWSDYDRQLDLAAEHGITTIIGILLDLAPQWAFQKFPHARVGVVKGSKVQQRLNIAPGTKAHSFYTGATAVGGWPGLCFDNKDVLKQGDAFLEALVKRYQDHPGMGGYDVWNELNQYGDFGACHCKASATEFRRWLAQKYGSLKNLGEAWYRYSYAEWEDVQIPMTVGPYPDSIDWALFRIDNAVRLLDHRVDLIRKLDTKNPITTHAIPLGMLEDLGPETYPVFQVTSRVDIHGYSGGSNHEENSRLRWKHWAKMDLIRSAAKGKPFWAAEMPSGASWGMRGVELDEGRIVSPSDLRLYSLTHFAGGARGIFSPRWRPLQDGKHAGNFGFYAMDGSPTDRSEAAEEIARWANAKENARLWEAKPVVGDIGIVVVPESQIHNYVSQGDSQFYYKSVVGVYQAFLFNNIQVDFVHADFFETDLSTLYLPFPLMLPETTVQKLKQWVADGGTLISEGCPAYYGDRGKAGTDQPNYGLDELFGARQEFVQFTPDLLEDLYFITQGGLEVKGGIYLQTYELTTGKSLGKFEDGRTAMVENTFGQGRTLLIGTFPGYGYATDYNQANRRFFSYLLDWATQPQHILSSDERIIARLQTSEENRLLWIINSSRENVPVELTLTGQWGSIDSINTVWGNQQLTTKGQQVRVTVPAREGMILELL